MTSRVSTGPESRHQHGRSQRGQGWDQGKESKALIPGSRTLRHREKYCFNAILLKIKINAKRPQ